MIFGCCFFLLVVVGDALCSPLAVSHFIFASSCVGSMHCRTVVRASSLMSWTKAFSVMSISRNARGSSTDNNDRGSVKTQLSLVLFLVWVLSQKQWGVLELLPGSLSMSLIHLVPKQWKEDCRAVKRQYCITASSHFCFWFSFFFFFCCTIFNRYSREVKTCGQTVAGYLFSSLPGQYLQACWMS